MRIGFARHLQPDKASLVYKSRHRRASWITRLHPAGEILVWLILFHASGHASDPSVTSAVGAVDLSRCSSSVCSIVLSPEDREALGRLAYAEAGNQGEEGLAAVLYAVLNRLASRHFGSDVTTVIEASGQFEPVDHAGGHWRNLPSLSAWQHATIETILGLIQQGRLPDPTHGATFFQNPRIVAARELAGQVRAGLTNFNNQTPIAVIRDHAFFGRREPNGLPAQNEGPQAHLVYAPGVTPGFRVERIDAGTPASPHGVIYRISPLSETQAMPVGPKPMAIRRVGVEAP